MRIRGRRGPSTGSPVPRDRALAWALVALVAAAVAGLASDLLVPSPAAPGADVRDPSTRTCLFRRADLRIAPEAVLFDGAFAPLPREAKRDVKEWMEIYGGAFADTFRAYLGRARRWEGRLSPLLEREGVPGDFLYLAAIESGFNPRAHSRFHAVGIWQFRRLTALREGLAVRWDVDQRRDPVAATEAAARHLRRLRRGLGDWPLAAAAYNAGWGRVRRGLRRAGGDAGYWDLSRRRLLPRQTRQYVPKLLAAARMAHDPAGTGLGFVPIARSATRTRAVEVDPGGSLDAVARAAEVPPERIRSLNPHLVRGRAPARAPAEVRVPASAADAFRARYRQIPTDERRGGVVHVVRRRETLGGIARRYDVPLRALRAANDGVRPRRLRPGQRLRVPAGR